MSSEFNQVNKLKKIPHQNNNFNDMNSLPIRENVLKSSPVKDIYNDGKFIERLIKISRVTKVTKGGKKLSFRAVVVIGNENGKVGVGIGKAEDVVNAFKKAKTNGRKNLIQIPLTKSLTIPHPIIGDVAACKIILKPGVEGSGVMAGGAVRTVLEVAGIKNIIAKQLGSDNLLNNARATIAALEKLITRTEVDRRLAVQSSNK
jgi:small subunit ribosomal protein S5